MNNTAGRQTKSRAEREAEQRSQRRAEQAGIVAALKSVLEADEQLLGFARGRIAGGFRGKLNVGPEALFAPLVNIGLTERRLVLQHIHTENGRPSPILPHFFALSEIESLTFSDIETYGADPACRLIVRMSDQLYCRLRLRGQLNFESAESIAEVFNSLTGGRRSTPTPTQRACSQCRRILDQPYKFCPYCGQEQPEETHAAAADNRQPETSAQETSAQEAMPIDIAAEAVHDEPAAEAPPAAEAEADFVEPAVEWPTDPLADDQPEAAHENVAEAAPAAEDKAEVAAEPAATGEPAATADPLEAHEATTAPAIESTPDEENIRYHDDTLSQGEF